MNSSLPSDSLSRPLASWRVVAPRNPQFRTAVWTRIEADDTVQPWAVYARRHAAAVGGALALAVMVGALTGHEWARARRAADSARMAAAYVQEFDGRVLSPR